METRIHTFLNRHYPLDSKGYCHVAKPHGGEDYPYNVVYNEVMGAFGDSAETIKIVKDYFKTFKYLFYFTCEAGMKYWVIDKGHRHEISHRLDGPATIDTDGSKEWYKNGKRHRAGDLPASIDADGTKMWYKNGNRHRAWDRPAVTYLDGHKEWCIKGERHRTKGPAVIYACGTTEWWLEGRRKIQPEDEPVKDERKDI